MREPTARLGELVSSGEAILFTGAGFSADARDQDGRPLPTSADMSAELWRLCFGDDPQDDSALCDLYDVALARAPDALAAYLGRRLRVRDDDLPAHYAAWFRAPWRRIYTLNVDDLELAVARRFPLPRPIVPVTALDGPPRALDPGALEVVHLNGLIGATPGDLMFSTFQYAARLCGRDPHYERLAADLDRAPFVFVGTTLDEAVLWQHVERQRSRKGAPRDAHPPFLLIARALSRARQALLEGVGIEWIEGTAAGLAPR